MKKSTLLCGLLAFLSTSSFAYVGSKPVLKGDDSGIFTPYYPHSHNFYTLLINNSADQIDVYTKNGSNWDNYGWCNGEQAAGGKISVGSNESAVYCGGNSHSVNNTGQVQHEWWFHQDGQWNQNFSEQWLTSFANLNETKIAEFNDFDRESNSFIPLTTKQYACDMQGDCGWNYYSYYYKITDSYINSVRNFISSYWGEKNNLSFENIKEALKSEKVNGVVDTNEHRLAAMTNTATVYEVNKNGKEMTVECYALPILFDWKDHNSLRQGENLCPDEHGNKRIIKIEH